MREVHALYFMFLKRPPTGESQYEVRMVRYCGRTKGSEMDDMGGLVLVIQCLRLRRVPMAEINSMNARYSFAYAPEIGL